MHMTGRLVGALAVALLTSVLWSAPSEASLGTVVVDDDGAQCHRADATTISAALAKVRPGGTVRVSPGHLP